MTNWTTQRLSHVLMLGFACGGTTALPANALDESGNPPPAPIAQTAPAAAPGQAPGSPPAERPASEPKPQASGTPAVVLDEQDAENIMGKNVDSSAGEDMGRIVDIIVSHEGAVRAAIIDFGGFLGVGTRKIAVDWHALQFHHNGKTTTITATLTKNQVRISPEYKAGEPIVILGSKPAEPSEPAAPEPPAATTVPPEQSVLQPVPSAPAPDQAAAPHADSAPPQAPK